ncbi:hypothetical protein N7540_006770 [Penicillium herquei]|nr:hypothetical protein N7540_006770 [Penicillium herquei]
MNKVAVSPVLAPHVLSVIPALWNMPRATRSAGSTTQRQGSKMSSPSLNIYYRDGSISSITVRDKNQIINTRRKLMEDGWIVMQNQTFLDSTVEQRQIEHNDAVKQFLQVDEGTYLPRRFRKREVHASDSLLVPPNGTSDLQIVYVLHLGGGVNTAWIFEYLASNEPLRRSVSLSGTDMYVILIAYSSDETPNSDRKQNLCCGLDEGLEDSICTRASYRTLD